MTKILFTVEEYNGANNAGPKAKNDIKNILKDDGFKLVSSKINVHSKIAKLYAYFVTIPRLFNKNQIFDEIYFQYPTYSSFLMKKLINVLRRHTRKLIFIIHDIESLRIFVNNKEYWKSEKELLESADGLIVHNEEMKKWLKSRGIEIPMVNLEIFDYLSNFQPISNYKFSKSVCFAGNLSKSEFLNNLSFKNITLSVYGPNSKGNYKTGVEYNGQYSPNELPQHLTQNFGLVWDGSSSETCNGKFGNYMKYNNPHKVSLYLSSGIPVVIWRHAALAKFIVNNHLGIAVDSLQEMDERVAAMSESEYNTYKTNAIKISGELRSGEFIKKAVIKIEEQVQ